MLPPGAARRTPWDAAAFGIDTFEILRLDEEVLHAAARTPGHYTVRIDPLADKRLLHEHGFYYCDTLLEPTCASGEMIAHPHPGVSVAPDAPLEPMLALCTGAFRHDRFHRDFNVDPARADARYARWLAQLHAEGKVYGLSFQGESAGFIALEGRRMVLHALAPSHRGRGLAKYFWSAACTHFFESKGLAELESSISAANLPVVNLYASLGFRFRAAADLYHLFVRPL